MDLSHDTLERYRLHAEICKVLTDAKGLMHRLAQAGRPVADPVIEHSLNATQG